MRQTKWLQLLGLAAYLPCQAMKLYRPYMYMGLVHSLFYGVIT